MTDTPTAPPAAESPEAQIAYTRWLTQLRADMAETVGGVLLRGARAVQVGTPEGVGRAPVAVAATSASVLMGYSFALQEPAGPASAGPGFLVIRDGQGGPVVLTLALFDGAPLTQWFGPGGISFSQGIHVIGDFAFTGSVFLRGSD